MFKDLIQDISQGNVTQAGAPKGSNIREWYADARIAL